MSTVIEPMFSLTPEQKDHLTQWKKLLEGEQAQEWIRDEKAATESIHRILEKAGFREGNDLTSGELDAVFHQMRELINNRVLARNLYEDNGLANFNSKLRQLFVGNEPLADRVNQFLGLKRVGILTVSHFLCAFDPREYPEITGPTMEVLSIDSTQTEIAYRQALREQNISSPQNYYNETLEYLRDAVIFHEIKNFLDIEFYFAVNDLLWLARGQAGVEPKPPVSVSLEKDLRDTLAENPNLVERGLSLVQKEYAIPGAGVADLLCQDRKGNFVIIETKKGRESDKVVGQILRYVGGLRKEGKKTRGIIIVNEPDEKLDFAVEAVKDFLKVKYYKVRFEILDKPG